MQKKTFTKWVNSHLQRVKAHANDLYHDLQDGRKLIMLLEILSGERLVSAFSHHTNFIRFQCALFNDTSHVLSPIILVLWSILQSCRCVISVSVSVLP